MKIKDLFHDALPIITKFAPTIGAAIGGPVGVAAGYVVPVLANAFGAKSTDIKDLVNKILADPGSEGKLEAIEQEHGDWVGALMNNVTHLTSAKINVELTWEPLSSPNPQ